MLSTCLWSCAEEAAAGRNAHGWKSSDSPQGHPAPRMEIATSPRAGWKHNKQPKTFSEQTSQCFRFWAFYINLVAKDFFYSAVAEHQTEELKATYIDTCSLVDQVCKHFLTAFCFDLKQFLLSSLNVKKPSSRLEV